jgi:hypothetical protein
MDARASGFVAAEWDRLKQEWLKGTMLDEQLHAHIVDILTTCCFYCDENLHFAKDRLMEAMPRYHYLVRKTNLKKQIKVVKETAMRIACPLGNR